MGTNYYLAEAPCVCCERRAKPLHIGKQSAGWRFLWQALPEEEIRTSEDWMKRLSHDLWERGSRIEDEYGKQYSLVQFVRATRGEGEGKGWTAIIGTRDYADADGEEMGLGEFS